MQISIESVGSLERRMTVGIDAQEIDSKVEDRLKDIAKKIKLDGFRPGKVPLKVVKQRFADSARYEIIQERIESSLKDAVKENTLQLANRPEVEITKDDKEHGLEYVATFEVYPEIKSINLEGITLEKPVVSISDDDIDAIILRWRQAQAEWTAVERPAHDGDRVILDFESKIDGEVLKDGSAEDAEIILGSNMMLAGFEEGLIGASAGEIKELTVTVPEQHSNKKIAGKQMHVTATIKKVEEAKLPEVDEAFCKAHGISEGGEDKLREHIKDQLDKDIEKAIRAKLKKHLFDQMLEKNPLEVPSSLVSSELSGLKEHTHAHEHEESTNQEELREQAEKNVKIGMLFGQYVNDEKISADPKRVSETVETFAQSFPQDREQILELIQKDQKLMSRIVATALEEQVLDKLLEKVELEEKPTTYKEFINVP